MMLSALFSFTSSLEAHPSVYVFYWGNKVGSLVFELELTWWLARWLRRGRQDKDIHKLQYDQQGNNNKLSCGGCRNLPKEIYENLGG